MFLPTNTYAYEFLIVVVVFLLLMMNALATFVPRYTMRDTKRKSKEDSDHEKYLGQAYGHTSRNNRFPGLISGVPSVCQDHHNDV